MTAVRLLAFCGVAMRSYRPPTTACAWKRRVATVLFWRRGGIMKTTKKSPQRRRYPRCGLLWQPFAGRSCVDCERQVELLFVTAVLGVFVLRTEVKCIRHPDRFRDPRGAFWGVVQRLLRMPEGFQVGPA
jgi:hypothetical protein